MTKTLDEIKSLLEYRIPDNLNEYDSKIYDQLYLVLEKWEPIPVGICALIVFLLNRI